MRHRIIDVAQTAQRLFALGLDSMEIAHALSMREAEIIEALEVEPYIDFADLAAQSAQHAGGLGNDA